MTGKKNAWEGIVLVPFIDQARLLAACVTINESTLTPIEKDRNKLGIPNELTYHRLIFVACLSLMTIIYDTQPYGSFVSPAPYLGDIIECHVRSVAHQLPPLSPDAHPFHLLPGAKFGIQSPSGFPTLKTSEFTPTYVHAKVNVSYGKFNVYVYFNDLERYLASQASTKISF